MYYRDEENDFECFDIEKNKTVSTKECAYCQHKNINFFSNKKRTFAEIVFLIASILMILSATLDYKIVVYKCEDKKDFETCEIIHEDLNGFFEHFLKTMGF